jgi:hypothetical protein
MFSAWNTLLDLVKKTTPIETDIVTIIRQRPYRKNRVFGIFPFVPSSEILFHLFAFVKAAGFAPLKRSPFRLGRKGLGTQRGRGN